jgi:hypothetical protein
MQAPHYVMSIFTHSIQFLRLSVKMPLIYFGLLFLRGSVVTWFDFVLGLDHILYSHSLFIFFDVVRQRAPHLFWFFHTSCSFVVMWFVRFHVRFLLYTLFCICATSYTLAFPFVKLCFRVTYASLHCVASVSCALFKFSKLVWETCPSFPPAFYFFLNWVLLTSCQVLITYYIRFWSLSDNVSGPYRVAILFVFGYCQASCCFTHFGLSAF